MTIREQAPTVGYVEPATWTRDTNGDVEAGIYIHFPFCRHLCTYCDFDTFAGLDGLVDSYVDAAVRQIATSPLVRATTLYVGGGTPSMMGPEQASRLMDASRERFGLGRDAEATIEANPNDMSFERLHGFREAGFNRLSVGVQSVSPRLLRLLGRRHSADDAATAMQAARSAGFENLSVDLMYGLPLQDSTMWRETVETVIQWGVEHVSSYMLTVEAGTPLERGVSRGTLTVPPDEEVVGMYGLANEVLARGGFHRYEISNWARPGRESAHNLTYWRNRPYLGIGAGAAGCWGGRRYKVLPSVQAYIKGARSGKIPLSENEPQDRRRDMSDTLMLGLRLDEGVSVRRFRERYGEGLDEQFGEVLAWGESNGLLERSGDSLRLTERGVLLSNELFQRLL